MLPPWKMGGRSLSGRPYFASRGRPARRVILPARFDPRTPANQGDRCMLKNLDPILTPELLFVLATMGHGDDLVVCDANFPAASIAGTTVHGRVLELPVGVDRAARAILSGFPLDEHVEAP